MTMREITSQWNIKTTNEVNVFTPTQIKQMKEVLTIKVNNLLDIPCGGLCWGACGKECKNWLY